jgi:hypothetical protein
MSFEFQRVKCTMLCEGLNFLSCDCGKQRAYSKSILCTAIIVNNCSNLKKLDAEMRPPEEYGEPNCNNQSYSVRLAWRTGERVSEADKLAAGNRKGGGCLSPAPHSMMDGGTWPSHRLFENSYFTSLYYFNNYLNFVSASQILLPVWGTKIFTSQFKVWPVDRMQSVWSDD